MGYFDLKRVSVFGDEFELGSVSLFYPSIIPAIVADIKDTKVPPTTAFTPKSERFFRCDGANIPMSPNCIPIDEKLLHPYADPRFGRLISLQY